jgi:hypothetical protein
MRRWWIGGLAGVLAIVMAMGGRSARACLGEHYSLDYQTAASPLIVVGKVLKVTPGEADKRLANLGEAGPSTATVEVIKVIKGEVKGKTIVLSSGPIRSCAPWSVHATFAVGETYIYICGTSDGEKAGLMWGGCRQSVSMLEAVEGSLKRSREWRTDYLARVEKGEPATFRAAGELAAKLKEASAKWPERYEEPANPFVVTGGWIDPDEKEREATRAKIEEANAAVEQAVDELAASLDKVPMQVVVTLLAMNNARGENPWMEKSVWWNAVEKYADRHAEDVRRVHEAEWRRLLAGAGVQGELIDRYIEQVRKESQYLRLRFPLGFPDPWNRKQPLDGEALTTDFILRAQGANRGHSYLAYGMGPGVLSALDAKRLALVLPRMLGSSEPDARHAARMAICAIPGAEFSDAVADDVLFKGGGRMWWGMRDAPAEKMRAVIESAYRMVGTGNADYVWDTLRNSEWFGESVVAEAKRRLEKAPKDGSEARAIGAYLRMAEEELARRKKE